METKFDTQKVFDKYVENDRLNEADIFHLYDTQEECFADNSGYHDSRHFELWGYNSETMEKAYLGRHDGILNTNNSNVVTMIRVYADGSVFVRFKSVVRFISGQCIQFI